MVFSQYIALYTILIITLARYFLIVRLLYVDLTRSLIYLMALSISKMICSSAAQRFTFTPRATSGIISGLNLLSMSATVTSKPLPLYRCIIFFTESTRYFVSREWSYSPTNIFNLRETETLNDSSLIYITSTHSVIYLWRCGILCGIITRDASTAFYFDLVVRPLICGMAGP